MTLRAVEHPGQAETLVHFTGRARQDFAPEVVFLEPELRLDLIVSEERLLARPPYGARQRTACLSESDPDGVAALIRHGHFAGWGIVLHRTWVWEQGGGPVWYTRDDVWRQVSDQDLLKWMVRTSPAQADWLHEREWRIPAPAEHVDLEPSGVAALLVSDPDWCPRVSATGMHGDGRLAAVEITARIATLVPRWYWDGQSITVLPPLPLNEEVLAFLDERPHSGDGVGSGP